jgi:hypothetical protein
MRAIIQFQAMPHRLKRFLLALIVALAVPVQGFAAVSAGLCMAFEHHGEHHHSSQGVHTGEHHDGHDHGATGHASCGSCIGCCASAAIASSACIDCFAPAAAAPAAAARPDPNGVQPHPLDRPPLAL